MRVSKYVKAHKDILIEYIYDDGNNLSETYEILVNSRDTSYSFVSPSQSASNNTTRNQLFPLDKVTDYYGIVNTGNYSFLQYKDYSAGFPIRFDTIKIHLPINYTFGEYIGCYLRVYTFDKTNKKEYSLSNYYYDQSDVNLSNLISLTSPPLKFQEKLWGKSLNIELPSVYAVSRQMSGTAPKTNSLNANLTGGPGLSQNAPVFMDFSFITKKVTINGIVTYYLTSPKKISIPQTPDFENLGTKIEHSTIGDFFEIYGIFNGNVNEFKTFIDNSRLQGKKYHVEYDITLYEQNIRGKSQKIIVTDNFNDKVEYRPIIKYTTTTAIIDVEMRLIESADESIIYRRASYGMLQDEVGKYSLNMTKINIKNANKPKIYNLKTFTGLLGAGLDFSLFKRGTIITGQPQSIGGSAGLTPQSQMQTDQGGVKVVLQPVYIDRTVLADKFNLIAKSENVTVGKNVFFGIGKIKILLQPFDNIITFVIAKDVSTEQTPGINSLGNLAFVKAPEYLDMSNMGEIKFVIKNDSLKFETTLYMSSNQVDLSRGQVVFRIPETSMRDIKRIYDAGQNIFYITSKLNSQTTSVYAGLFSIFDSAENIDTINVQQQEIEKDVLSAEKTDVLIDPYSQNSAIVYRRRIVTETTQNGTGASNGGVGSGSGSGTGTSANTTNTSVNAIIKVDGVTYEITVNSGLKIDGYEWTSDQIKGALTLNTNPINLKFRDVNLYSSEQFLDGLKELSVKLQNKYIATPEDRAVLQEEQSNFNQPTSSQPTVFNVGDSVKVIDGPFSTFTGVVDDVFPNDRKLDITVRVFGRDTQLELSFSQVEKL